MIGDRDSLFVRAARNGIRTVGELGATGAAKELQNCWRERINGGPGAVNCAATCAQHNACGGR